MPPTPTLTPTLGLGSTHISEQDGMVMVYVPAGEFLMGSPNAGQDAQDDEKPQHTVYLDAFWIDQTEVTNAMFARFVSDTGYETGAQARGWAWVLVGTQWKEVTGADWQHPQGPITSIDGLDDHPVVQIGWDDANAYCQWAGRQLPTEAQWEKAARGTDGLVYPWGDSFDGSKLNFCDANCFIDWQDADSDDGYARTAPVGSYPAGASPYGGLDMIGNVWEWVLDWYGRSYYASSPDQNPTGPTTGEERGLRGGGWS
ncbi:MAG: formylglycine-generating enzyme family protein, partial [Anaerolineae bacterium]|nr:formylglycine-generating enzyme family protein [Anaerolineae bacterium]